MTTFKNMKQVDHIKNILKLTCEEIIDAIDTDLRIVAEYKAGIKEDGSFQPKETIFTNTVLDLDIEDYKVTTDWQTIPKEHIAHYLIEEFTDALPSILDEYYRNKRNKAKDKILKQHHLWDGEKTFA